MPSVNPSTSKQRKFTTTSPTPSSGTTLPRGLLGGVVHPFATSFIRDDARITTRWYPDFLNPSLFGALRSDRATPASKAHPDLAHAAGAGHIAGHSRIIIAHV
ncbi:MAG: hypothetical protein IPJ94_29160 [Chloroflexi bacterium]|nr:hypothetical protein [Chloroflexota bacterium]